MPHFTTYGGSHFSAGPDVYHPEFQPEGDDFLKLGDIKGEFASKHDPLTGIDTGSGNDRMTGNDIWLPTPSCVKFTSEPGGTSFFTENLRGNAGPGGTNFLTGYAEAVGLDSSTVDVMVQQQSNLPLELEFSTSLTHRTNTLEVGQPFVLTYEVYNPTSQPIDVSSLDQCHLLIEFESSILGPSCNAGVDVIEPYGVLPLGHSFFQPSITGDAVLTVSTPDGDLVFQKEIYIQQADVLENSLQLSSLKLSNRIDY